LPTGIVVEHAAHFKVVNNVDGTISVINLFPVVDPRTGRVLLPAGTRTKVPAPPEPEPNYRWDSWSATRCSTTSSGIPTWA